MTSRLSVITLVALSCLTFAPQAKADFIYTVQSSFASLNVEFESPTFQENFNDFTALGVGSSSAGTVTEFSLSGSSAGCAITGVASASPGPCWIAYEGFARFSFIDIGAGVPAFTGTGTFSAGGTTITILQTPEPVSALLLLTVLGVVSVVARKRRLAYTSRS